MADLTDVRPQVDRTLLPLRCRHHSADVTDDHGRPRRSRRVAMDVDDDLTPYERERLANIKRNAEMLKQLGLQPCKMPAPAKLPQRKREWPRIVEPRALREGTRRSLRTRGNVAAAAAATVDDNALGDDALNEDAHVSIDYASWPIEPTDVDDDEFLAFATLRKFRFERALELELETYKIAMNRTLLEMVRRRRNDSAWATSADDDARAADLIQCWGIGPAKAKTDGFGAELARVLDQPDMQDVIERSRRRSEAVSSASVAVSPICRRAADSGPPDRGP